MVSDAGCQSSFPRQFDKLVGEDFSLLNVYRLSVRVRERARSHVCVYPRVYPRLFLYVNHCPERRNAPPSGFPPRFNAENSNRPNPSLNPKGQSHRHSHLDLEKREKDICPFLAERSVALDFRAGWLCPRRFPKFESTLNLKRERLSKTLDELNPLDKLDPILRSLRISSAALEDQPTNSSLPSPLRPECGKREFALIIHAVSNLPRSLRGRRLSLARAIASSFSLPRCRRGRVGGNQSANDSLIVMRGTRSERRLAA